MVVCTIYRQNGKWMINTCETGFKAPLNWKAYRLTHRTSVSDLRVYYTAGKKYLLNYHIYKW